MAGTGFSTWARALWSAVALVAIEAHAQSPFTQTIPIKLPKGVGGTQPELSLTYDPSRGNGMMGMGWQLTGLPVITRVNNGNGIGFSGGDTYAHSQLGILVRLTDGSYRSKNETFVKLVPAGTCGDGPCSWTAYHPSGVRSFYGTTASSQLLAYVPNNPTPRVRTWGVSEVVDLFGNSYDVAYQNDTSQGLIYPSKVTYNKAPNVLASAYRTVELTYESGRTDTEPGYPQDAHQETRQRLKWIVVKSGNVLIRQYRLDYECGTVSSTCATTTARSRLIAITEIGRDGASALPSMTYTYQTGAAGLGSVPSFNAPESFMARTSWGVYGWDRGLREADLNGDGKSDLIWGYYDYGTTYRSAWINTGSAWSRKSAFDPPADLSIAGIGPVFTGIDGSGGTNWDGGLRLVDLNNDGLPDLLLGWYSYGVVYRSAWLNNGGNCQTAGCAWTRTPQFAPPADFVGRDWSSNTGWDSGLRLADVDGDARPDLVQAWHNYGSPYSATWLLTDSGWVNSPSRAPPAGYYFAIRNNWTPSGWAAGLDIVDLNGDGKKDLAFAYADLVDTGNPCGPVMCSPVYTTSSRRAAWVSLDSGGWASSPQYTPPTDFAGYFVSYSGEVYSQHNDFGSRWADLNADGKPDLVQALTIRWPSQATMRQAWLNTGPGGWVSSAGFVPPADFMLDKMDMGVRLTDINGDGRPDLLQGLWSTTGSISAAWINTGVNWGRSDTWAPPVSFAGTDWTGSWDSGLRLMDLDGDGRMDYTYGAIGWENTAPLRGAWISNFSWAGAPDLVRTVNNGVGGTVTVTYAPAPKVPGAIVTGSTQPGIPDTSPRQLVTRVVSSDGTGASYGVSYGYWNGRVLPGRIPDQRGLGFAMTTAWDEQTSQASETYYSQNPGLEGQPSGTIAKAANGQLMRSTTFSYVMTNPSSGTELALETSRTVSVHEPNENGAFVSSQTTAILYDAYGNPTVKTQDATNLPQVVVTTTYANDTSAWILGRITGVRTSAGGTTLGEVQNTWTGHSITAKREWLNTNNTWRTTSMGYDSNGDLTSVTDALNHTTTTAFDTKYRTYPTAVTNALGHQTSTAYDDAGLPTSFTDANGQVSTTYYDGFGRKLVEYRADGGQTDYAYGLRYIHSPSCWFPPCADSVVIGRYERSTAMLEPPSMSLPYGKVVVSVDNFDGSGMKYETQRPGSCSGSGSAGSVIVTTLKDAAGRPNRTSLPYCAGTVPVWTTTTYDSAGRISTITTPDGSTVTRSYGSAWKSETDGNGVVTRTTFDARDKVTSILDAGGLTTSYVYDALGRVVGVTQACVPVPGFPSCQAPQQPLSVATINYDSLNRRTSVVDPTAGTTTYVYNLGDKLTSYTNAGKTVTFTYDALDRVVSRKAGAEAAVTYAYDDPTKAYSRGRLTKVTDAGGTTVFGYTKMGQIAAYTKAISGSNYSQSFTYDLLGRTKSMTYPDGSLVEYEFTDAGQHSQVKLNGTVMGSWTNFTAIGKPQNVSYGNGVTTTHGYDVMSHLTSLVTLGPPTNPNPELQKLSYGWYSSARPGGLDIQSITDLRASKQAADGSNTDETQSFAYDALYRLTQANGVWGAKSYTYDALGNPTTFGGIVNRTLAFTGHKATSGTNLSATYDAAGNMTKKVLDGVTWNYTWTVENRLATASLGNKVTARMTYDADGQRVQKIYYPKTGPTVTSVYIGDIYEKRAYSDGTPPRHTLNLYANGQLVATVTRQGNITTAFNNPSEWRKSWGEAKLYSSTSALGAVMKAGHFLAAIASHPSVIRWAPVTFFGLAALALVTVFLTSLARGTWNAAPRYPLRVRLAALSLVLAFGMTACSPATDGSGGSPHADRDYLLAGDTTKGPAIGTYFYHRNHINSSSVVTDANGVEATRLVYLPYGELSKTNSSGTDTVTSKFTGQEFDEETGLYYYGARYYEPAIGRFISADPVIPDLADGQSYNRYSYARDNPIIYTDPTGQSFWGILGDILLASLAPWAYVNALAIDLVGSSFDAKVGAVQFLQKTATYAWETIKGIASNPMSLALFLMAIAIAVASGGTASPLSAVLVKAAIPIIATSLARAAGVKNPIVLGLIAVAAGAVANQSGLGEVLKGAAKTGAERLVLPRIDPGLGAMYALADFAVANMTAAVPAGQTQSGAAPASSGDFMELESATREGSVYAVSGGTVVAVGWENAQNQGQGYGYRIRVQVNATTVETYAHTAPGAATVRVGDQVTPGEYLTDIAVPTNGHSSGPHLHFDRRVNGVHQAVNFGSRLPVGAGAIQSSGFFRNNGTFHGGYDFIYP